MKILITSGGTKVPIDEVRHIGNMSSGTFASKIATQALIDRDHVCFLTSSEGKTPMKIMTDLNNAPSDFTILEAMKKIFVARSCKERYEEVPYKNFDEYAYWLEHYVKNGKFDAIILAAAVSDYLVEPVKGKIRSSSQLNIELKPAPKLISKIREWGFKGVLVGFKLLVDATKDELIVAANTSVIDNGCDFVVANDLRDIWEDNHKITIVNQYGHHEYPKEKAVDGILQMISDILYMNQAKEGMELK